MFGGAEAPGMFFDVMHNIQPSVFFLWAVFSQPGAVR